MRIMIQEATFASGGKNKAVIKSVPNLEICDFSFSLTAFGVKHQLHALFKVRETIYILGLGVPQETPEPLVLKVLSPLQGDSKDFQEDFTSFQLFTGDQPCCFLHHLHLWVWPRRHWEVDLCWPQANSQLVMISAAKQVKCVSGQTISLYESVFLQANWNGGGGEEEQEH